MGEIRNCVPSPNVTKNRVSQFLTNGCVTGSVTVYGKPTLAEGTVKNEDPFKYDPDAPSRKMQSNPLAPLEGLRNISRKPLHPRNISRPKFGDRRLLIEPGPLPKPETWSFFDCATTDAALVIEGVPFMDGEKFQPLLVTELEHLKGCQSIQAPPARQAKATNGGAKREMRLEDTNGGDLEGNDTADILAKAGACEVPEPSAPFTFLEIFSRTKHLNKTAWITPPPEHH
ncbi:hypothetical protein TNCV_1982751 [Trichonephila clavipes]|nr:hypothetical protein TNCV_1982751 [Trichonephila clavipes]